MRGRDPALPVTGPSAVAEDVTVPLPDLPVDAEGVHDLLDGILRGPQHREKMVKVARRNARRIMGLTLNESQTRCGVVGVNGADQRFTGRDWIRAALDGKDLMSDFDSPISKNAWSGLVWRSMGSWRMRPEAPGHVHLECRRIQHCLPDLAPVVFRDVFEGMRAIARFVQTLDHAAPSWWNTTGRTVRRALGAFRGVEGGIRGFLATARASP